jgi:hypothetical protein
MKCDSSNKCLICDSVALYSRVGDTCIKNKLSFCAISYTLNSCSLCIPGYYLEANRKCVLNTQSKMAVPNCLRYSSFSRCQMCMKLFYIADKGKSCKLTDVVISKCQIYFESKKCGVCADSVPNDDQSLCLNIDQDDPNCMLFSNSTICVECKPGYWLNQNFYLDNLSEVFQSLFTIKMNYLTAFNVLIDIRRCSPEIRLDNCKIVDQRNVICLECHNGYFLNENGVCVKNPDEVSINANAKIPFCKETYVINELINGINVSRTLCFVCFADYYLSVNGRKCQKNTLGVENCKVYSQSFENRCLVCNSQYYANFDQTTSVSSCVLRGLNKNCAVPDHSSNKCLNCTFPTYVKHNNDQFCSPSIENCLTYDQTGQTLICSTCEATFHFDPSTSTCRKNTQFDPYCNTYNSQSKCIECTYGYYNDTGSGKCLSNSQEYISRANCEKFDQNTKDTCKTCGTESVILEVRNTCKVPFLQLDPATNSDITKKLDNCEIYELDFSGLFNCLKVHKFKDDPPCDLTADDPNCESFILNSSTNSIEKVPKSIAGCVEYQDSYVNGSPINCIKCKEISKAIVYLLLSDICFTSVPSWCKKTSKDVTDKKCFSVDNYCALIHLGASNNLLPADYNKNMLISTCVNCITDTSHDYYLPGCFNACPKSSPPGNPFPFCYKTWNANTNSYDEVSTFGNQACLEPTYPYNKPAGETCLNLFSSTSLDAENQFACGNSAVYEGAYRFSTYLSPDGRFCINEDTITKPSDKCLKVFDSTCLLCQKEYFPVKKVQFNYTKEYVQSYFDGLTPARANCVFFDEQLQQCQRCDSTQSFRVTIQFSCVACNETFSATDQKEILCLTYINQQLATSSCFKIDSTHPVKPNPCLACASKFMSIFTFEDQKTWPIHDFAFTEAGRSVDHSNRGFLVQALQVAQCAPKSLIFTQNAQNKDLIVKNCKWGFQFQNSFYCLVCNFAFYSEVSETSSGVQYIEACKDHTDCDEATSIVFPDHEIRPYMSCQSCTINILMPTLYMYHDAKKSNFTVKFLFATNSTKNKTISCEMGSSNVPNCAAQMYVSNSILLNSIDPTKTSGLMVCIACLPMFIPETVKQLESELFPYRIVTSCKQVPNCASSYVSNKCLQCQKGYFLNSDQTECIKFAPTDIGLDFCNEVKDTTAVNKVCSKCKDGYKSIRIASTVPEFLLSCQEYSIINCKYYDGDTCIESTKKVGIELNMIVRKIFSEYFVNAPGCNLPAVPIYNCMFYTSETECYLCKPGYFLGGTKNDKCFPQNTPNCQKYSERGFCNKCVPGFSIKNEFDSAQKLIDVKCEVSGESERFPGCTKYSEKLCAECQPSFQFVKVNLGQRSLCLKEKVTDLCEEIDVDLLINEAILSCKKCKLLSEIGDDIEEKEYTLSQYDFIDEQNNFRNYSATGKVTLGNFLRDRSSYMRASSVLQPIGTKFCQPFFKVSNCISYNSENLAQNFKCSKCQNEDYYLNESENSCVARQRKTDTCVLYDHVSEDCLESVGSAKGTGELSALDQYLASNNVPFHTSQPIGISIFGCVKFSDKNVCSQCNSTTWLYNNICLNVKSVVPNCQIYYIEGFCTECQPGFLLYQNKCLIIRAKNCLTYLTNMRCLRCPMEFPKLDDDGHCQKNPEVPFCSVYRTPDICEQYEIGYVNSNRFCQIGSSIANCENIQDCKCRSCVTGYLVSSDKQSCVPNPSYDRNCKKFHSKVTCAVCSERHYMLKGQCVPCLTNEISCFFCEPSNPRKCLLCSQGYFMNKSGTCILIVGYVPPMISLLNQNNDLLSSIN